MPRGFLMLGTLASVRLRLMISFKYACLANLPGPSPQDKPCEPSAVIQPSTGHMGAHRSSPPNVGMPRFISPRHQVSNRRPSVAAQVASRLREQQTPP